LDKTRNEPTKKPGGTLYLSSTQILSLVRDVRCHI
jgi:hypothetical protein